MPNNVNDGRYIKESWNGQPIVSCENYTSTLQVMPDDVPAGVSSTTLVEFSICQDSSGTNCEGVGMDYIYVENNGDKYTVDPKYYDVKLSRVASRYTSCKPGVNLRHSIKH